MPWLTPDSSWEVVAEAVATEEDTAAGPAAEEAAMEVVATEVASSPSEEDTVDGPVVAAMVVVDMEEAAMEEDTEVVMEVAMEAARLSRSSRYERTLSLVEGEFIYRSFPVSS